MALTANRDPLPKFLDPAGLQAILRFLTAYEAHLREPEANPEPLAPDLKNLPHGCVHAVYVVAEARDYPMMGVSLGTGILNLVRPIDCAGFLLGTAFGLQLSDDHLDHGMERWAARETFLQHFDKHAADYPLPVPREQYANMLDLAFGLGDRAYGADSVDGRLFPDTVDHSGEVVQ